LQPAVSVIRPMSTARAWRKPDAERRLAGLETFLA
jgi:hypothetical protein